MRIMFLVVGGTGVVGRQVVERLVAAGGCRCWPTRMLRMSAAAVRPFNEVQARRMRLGALLDSRPQTVDTGAVWEELGILPARLTDWLDRLPNPDVVSQ
ncbi:hypothetical protein ACQPZ2_37670 [Nocardia pseudovaccinii]|uniref:hypothetical protein n=1 Tax=Nocardia pseudovaccinii TaxID=189540 RepID=UPI003D91899F